MTKPPDEGIVRAVWCNIHSKAIRFLQIGLSRLARLGESMLILDQADHAVIQPVACRGATRLGAHVL
jgi:hypothetical protein